MTELDIVAGRIICAGTFSYSGEQLLTYTPQLTATTTDPNLGSTGTAEGWWIKIGNLVSCWGRFAFSGVGISAGSGTYQVSLPTGAIELGPLNYVGSGPLLGYGVVRDNSSPSTGSRQITPRLSDTFSTTVNAGLVRLSLTDGSDNVVNHDSPFVWASGDRITFQCTYPAELEMLT